MSALRYSFTLSVISLIISLDQQEVVVHNQSIIYEFLCSQCMQLHRVLHLQGL